MKQKFEIGDLVRFSSAHALGVVIDIKEAGPGWKGAQEAKVKWLEPEGETFWCVDVTLEIISKVKK